MRGGMDASQYKDYVLVLLFIKYVSDKINQKIIAPLVKKNEQLPLSDFPDFNDAAKLGTGKEMADRLTDLATSRRTAPTATTTRSRQVLVALPRLHAGNREILCGWTSSPPSSRCS